MTRLLITWAAAASPAAAQVDPGDDPELTGETVVKRGESLLDETADAPAAAAMPVGVPRTTPVRPHQPEPAGGEGRLLTEGTFLVDQPGELRATPRGAWIFTPAVAEGDPPVRPLIVMPSQILGRLVRIVGEGTAAADVRLTGRVTLFHDQNYLLITAIGEQTDEDTIAELAPEPDPEQSDELSGAVESLIEELESERTGIRGVISGIGGGDETAVAPVAEGRVISRRKGRFVRLDTGELAVRFDNDAAASPIDAPLVIVPCAALEAVERTLEIHGDAMTATVSGQTLAYAGRSFLLPISIVVDRPSDELHSRQ